MKSDQEQQHHRRHHHHRLKSSHSATAALITQPLLRPSAALMQQLQLLRGPPTILLRQKIELWRQRALARFIVLIPQLCLSSSFLSFSRHRIQQEWRELSTIQFRELTTATTTTTTTTTTVLMTQVCGRHLHDPKDNTLLDDVVEEFLSGKNIADRVLLLVGPAGSGKSTRLRLAAQTMWRRYTWGETTPLPIRASLDCFDPSLIYSSSSSSSFSSAAKCEFVDALLRAEGFTDDEVCELKAHHELCFLFDAYEAIPDLPKNIYVSNALHKLKATMIVACDSDFLRTFKHGNLFTSLFAPCGEIPRSVFDARLAPQRPIMAQLVQCVIKPAREADMVDFLEAYSRTPPSCFATWEQYQAVMQQVPGLFELAQVVCLSACLLSLSLRPSNLFFFFLVFSHFSCSCLHTLLAIQRSCSLCSAYRQLASHCLLVN